MSAAAAIGLLLAQASTAPSAASAECLVRRAPDAMLALASSEPNTAEEGASIRRFRAQLKRCDAGPVPVGEESVAQFRAAISRTAALYLQRPRAGPNSNPNFSPNLFPVDRGYDQAVAMQAAYRLAHCVIAIDFNHAAQLVESKPGEADERAALDALLPGVAACVDRGQQASLPRQRLRAAIDIVFTRLLSSALHMVMWRRARP